MSYTDRTDGRTIGIGALTGVAAYLGGYLVTYVSMRSSVEERLSGFNAVAELFGGDPIPAWKAVGWLFYNSHFVETTIPTFGGTQTQNFVANADGGSMALLFLVPPLLLLGAGVAAAAFSGARSAADGARTGAGVVAGYLPLAVLGILVFGYAVGEGQIGPDAITAVLLAGVVYPLAFGSVGGALGAAVGRGE
ncbi:hypothetical protein SAMN06269185_0215 [Natronoarchaeum philippinense]|uniref:DUF7978 domain-containing protein n=1 Tax=Natronoarchaeum philippinense TaxID=558529 RepID=A0A285N179_NATPI|nr:transporter [Natronoarchaeum philippinense]SNZ03199.1 hypothetical protein SAMN06269185_0215 [Natronoarchaeum philippinense]